MSLRSPKSDEMGATPIQPFPVEGKGSGSPPFDGEDKGGVPNLFSKESTKDMKFKILFFVLFILLCRQICAACANFFGLGFSLARTPRRKVRKMFLSFASLRLCARSFRLWLRLCRSGCFVVRLPMKNVELIVRTLEDAGVQWVFGIPSGPVLPLIEALRASPVEFVLTASETSAAFMASAVGYLTGIPGVCVSTVGAGATNLTTGVGCAWLDRCPVIAITCNVGSQWLDRRIQMRIDHQAVFRPITKASFSAASESLAEILPRLFDIATAEPPGPVHLDLPEDIAQQVASAESVSRIEKSTEGGIFDLAA